MRIYSTQKSARIVAIILLFIISLNALAAGYSFIMEPSGNGIGISTDYLKDSAPFSDYFIPGIVLFTTIGILSSIVAVLAIRRTHHFPMLISLQGILYVLWIAIQLSMVRGFHPLHAIVGGSGIFLLIIGWWLRGEAEVNNAS